MIGLIGAETTREMQDGDCELAVASHEGDTKTIWNPNNTDEVENARRTYNDLRAKGYVAFKVDAKGEKGEQMTGFDAGAGKIIMVPPFQGG
jgi:hypothetical protein